MASSKEYLHFILEQLSDLEEINYRAMMGEYIIYYRGRIAGGIYDDRLLVKPTKSAVSYMTTATYELPYEGAKEMLLVEDVDSKEYPTNLPCDSRGSEALIQLGKVDEIYKYHVLHVSPTKINNWIIDILFSKYGKDVNRALIALLRRRNKKLFFTVGCYMDFIESYLKI